MASQKQGDLKRYNVTTRNGYTGETAQIRQLMTRFLERAPSFTIVTYRFVGSLDLS